MKSDGDFGRCAVNSDASVNSDGYFGRCAMNLDNQLLVFYITILVLISLNWDCNFGR